MTSPSRRNRPTTRPNSRPTSDIKPRPPVAERIVTPHSPLPTPHSPPPFRSWVLALATLAAWLPVSAEGETLKWGRDPVKVEKKPAVATSLRFTRPQTPTRRIDLAVRPTAFEDDGPQLTSGNAPAQTRSVVVNRSDAQNGLRSAQRSPSSAGPIDQPNTNSQLDKNIGTPFGDMPEPPPIEPTPPNQLEPNNLPMPEPNAGSSLLQPNDSQRQPPPSANELLPNPSSAGQSAIDASEPVAEPIAPTTRPELQKAQTSCRESLDRLKGNTIDKLSIEIGVAGNEGADYPYECSVDDGAMYGGRCWDQQTYLWKASALCHKPLYFEDEQLERYGHSFSPCFQPIVSGAHFFTRLPVLPYCMGVEPPCECIYALGHYRPGDCAPYMCNPIPLSCRGALIEAGAVTGAAAAIP